MPSSREPTSGGAAGCGGATSPGAGAAARVQPGQRCSSPVVDQPGDDDRAWSEKLSLIDLSRARPLDDQAAPDGCAGRRERRRSGASASASFRSRSIPRSSRREGLSLGQVVMTTGTRCGVAAELPRGVDRRYRRVHRHAEPATGRPARLPIGAAGGAGAGRHRGEDGRVRRRLRLGDVATWSRAISP